MVYVNLTLRETEDRNRNKSQHAINTINCIQNM